MLDDLIKERLRKLEKLKSHGLDAYPARVKRTHHLGEVIKDFAKLASKKTKVSVTGRVWAIRGQGGVIFADLKDESGSIQLVLKKDNLSDLKTLEENLDIGDFAEVQGPLFKTKRGEQSIEVKKWRIIVKSIRPLPSKWHGLEDVETRLRKRYLDIIYHPELKELFQRKAKFWSSMRETLKKEEFLEVETAVLENVPGGADAEPFVTHHNALDTDFYLRISLELPLKKLLVAGFEKVFEIGRIFRNEGIDAEHLQDYTQLEFYWAYADYNELMKFVEKLYKTAIKESLGTLVTVWQGQKINWAKKWPIVSYYDTFKKETGLDLEKTSEEDLRRKADNLGLKPDPGLGRGRLIDLLFKKARAKIIQPVFLIDPPVEIEPLAKRSDKNSAKVERFQIIACGTELGKGFSEANDPLDQRKRFEEQMRLREKGDKEAQRLDEDFLEALEYGMPPAAGFGVSERLFSVLMDKPVRETVIFPPMRPKS